MTFQRHVFQHIFKKMTTFHISFYALTHLSHVTHSKLHFYYLKHFKVCLNYTNYIISKSNAAAIQLLSYVQLFCDHVDCSLPGSPDHGILQARIQEWVATSSSRGLNLGLLLCKQMSLYRLSHQGSPSCLDVVFFFSAQVSLGLLNLWI